MFFIYMSIARLYNCYFTILIFMDVISVRTFCFGVKVVVVVALLFYVHGKHLRSCRDGHLT